MKYINLAWNWLVFSSHDSEKISATVKGSAIFTIITVIATLLHINGLSDLADHGISFVVEVGKVLSAAYGLYGAFRKVNRTLGGTNAVLQDDFLR